MNKSKRSWKKGLNRTSTRNLVSRGTALTWDQKQKQIEEKKDLRNQIKNFKEKKIIKRKELKEQRKQKKKQKMYNEIKSGQF